MTPPEIANIISIGSLLMAGISAYFAWNSQQRQARLEATQATLTANLSKQREEFDTALTANLSRQSEEFERKRFIVALWGRMEEVAEIIKDKQGNYNEGDIYYALNTLEFVSICWQNNIVDK